MRTYERNRNRVESRPSQSVVAEMKNSETSGIRGDARLWPQNLKGLKREVSDIPSAISEPRWALHVCDTEKLDHGGNYLIMENFCNSWDRAVEKKNTSSCLVHDNYVVTSRLASEPFVVRSTMSMRSLGPLKKFRDQIWWTQERLTLGLLQMSCNVVTCLQSPCATMMCNDSGNPCIGNSANLMR